MKIEDIAEQISFLVLRLMRAVKSRFLTLREITVPQLIILSTLEDKGRLSLKQLAKALGVSSATASILVDKLVKAGQIERNRDKEDRRRVIIKLTRRGSQTLERFRQELQRHWMYLLKNITPDERVTYLNILRKIVQSLEGK